MVDLPEVFVDPADRRSQALLALFVHEGLHCRWWKVQGPDLHAHFGPPEPIPAEVKRQHAELDTQRWLAHAPVPNELPELEDGMRRAIELRVFAAPMVVWGGHRFFGPERVATFLHCLQDRQMPVPPESGELFHDFSSPYSYLGAMPCLHLTLRPILLGALFRQIGTADVPLLTFSSARREWARWDLEQQARVRGLPFRFPKTFPLRSVSALRLALVLPELTGALYRAAWVQDRDIGDRAVLRAILGEQGKDPELISQIDDPEVKQALRHNTARAVQLGVPGAPSYRVDGQVFWGSDRFLLL